MAGNGLTAAVVGTGFGVLTHVRALRAAGYDVQALVGRDPDKTADRAQRCSIPRPCTSLAAALGATAAGNGDGDSGGVDVVAIATPPHTHAPLVIEAVG